MSSNHDELIKIKNATSGLLKRGARKRISKNIKRFRPEIEKAKELPRRRRQAMLKQLVDIATDERHQALQRGANSYGDANWAAAAVVESWLHELNRGDSLSIESVESIIKELEYRA